MTRKAVALAFVGVVAALAVVSFLVPDKLKVAGFETPGSESRRATERLHEALGYDPEPGIVALARGSGRIDSPAGQAAVRDVAAQFARDPEAARVETPFSHGGNGVLLSHDRRAALILVHFEKLGEQDVGPAIDRIRDRTRSPSLDLTYGGYAVGFHDDQEVVREDQTRTHLIALPVLGIVLIFVFRGLAAALLPLAIGAVSVLGALASLRLLSQAVNLSVFSRNLAIALGLGLAVNYSLFIISRYREELAVRGDDRVKEAVDATVATAGRAVVYSGATVAGACAALTLFPQQFIYSMGIGGMLTAGFSAASALFVVPALLPFVGRSGQRFGRAAPDVSSGGWYRFSKWVTAHAVPVAIVSALTILAVGLPATGVKWTFLDYRALPPELEARKVNDAITRDFARNLDYPISVTVARSAATDLRARQRRIARLPNVALVGRAERTRDGTGFIQLLPRTQPLSDESQQLIRDLRGLGGSVLVGGRIASFVDLKHNLRERAVPALVVVTVASLVVLFLLTGSVVLPIKALIMNAFTLFAVFGVLVAIFQDDLFNITSAIGYTGPGAIETAMSVVVIGVTLGVATDYSILLLSRVKEEHDRGRSNEEAVAIGLQLSGRVITNAALLLALALLADSFARVFLVQQLVIGIAIGLVLDATIVRACLVPALMRILGRFNWWAPHPLRRLHDRVDRRLLRSAEP